jgi:hypothetical protein
MKRTPLRRRAPLRVQSPLRRTKPLQRTPSMAATEAQRAAVAGRCCIVCEWDWRIDPAHLIPRSLGGCGDARCTVSLCRLCHRACDRVRARLAALTRAGVAAADHARRWARRADRDASPAHGTPSDAG